MIPPAPVFRHYITNERVPSTDALFQSTFSTSTTNLTASTSLLSLNSDADQSGGEIRHTVSDDEEPVAPATAKVGSASPVTLTRKPSHRSSDSLNSDESPRKKTSLSIDDKKPSVCLSPSLGKFVMLTHPFLVTNVAHRSGGRADPTRLS